MRARRVIWVVAAVVLAGIGHAFVGFQRDVYPIDGYVYYALAALAFIWALRSWRDASGAGLFALPSPGRGAHDRIFAFRNTPFGPPLVFGIVILNVLSALLALLFSSPIVFVGWGLSVVWLAAALRPSSPRVAVVSDESTVDAQAYVEPIAPPAAAAPRPALLLVGLLIALLGQIVIASRGESGASGVLADLFAPVADALHLQVLPDAASALAGLFILALGIIVYGVVTRSVALRDRPGLAIEVRPGRPAGWDGRRFVLPVVGLVLWLLVMQSAGGELTSLGPLALWLLALVLIGAAWRRIDADRGVRLGVTVARAEAYALAALVFVALAIWLIRLDRLPAAIWGDEGAYWTYARDLAAGVVPVNVFGFGTYGYPAAGSFYQSLWVGLLGPSILSWRVASVVAVLVALLPLYFLARSLLGRRVAFVSLVFFAASPWALAYGRIGYLYPQSIFPVTMSAALAVAALRRDSRFFAFAAGVMSGSTVMLYPSARFAIILCILAPLAFARLARASSLLRLALAFASALVLAAAPALLHGFAREPETLIDKLVENSMANVPFAEGVVGRDELLARASFTSTRNHQLFFEPSIYASLALRGWALTAISLNREGLANEHYVVGPLAAPAAFLYILGLAWSLARWRRPGYAVWPIWLLSGTFLLGAIETNPPHASDSLPVIPALAVLAALGLVGLHDVLRVYRPALPRRVEIGVLGAVALAIGAIGLQSYFVEMPGRYKANLEMSIFWSALEMPRGSTLVFARDETYPPDFEPWGLQNFDTGVGWLSVESANLPQADLAAACRVDCRIFYTPPYAAAVQAQLDRVFADGRVTTYANEAGDVIGIAYSPGGRP